MSRLDETAPGRNYFSTGGVFLELSYKKFRNNY